MMKMISSMAVCIFGANVLVGCSAIKRNGEEAFKTLIDNDVGKNINASRSYALPYEEILVDAEKVEHRFFDQKTMCQFSYIIDVKRQVILSWNYISNPENCYVYSSWWQPW